MRVMREDRPAHKCFCDDGYTGIDCEIGLYINHFMFGFVLCGLDLVMHVSYE